MRFKELVEWFVETFLCERDDEDFEENCRIAVECLKYNRYNYAPDSRLSKEETFKIIGVLGIIFGYCCRGLVRKDDDEGEGNGDTSKS